MTEEGIQNIILFSVLLDLDYYRSNYFGQVVKNHWRNRTGLLPLRKHEDALDGIVPYKPSQWLGRRLTTSERIKFCRTLPTLEEEGLLQCYTDSRGRTTHVALTDEGKIVAERLKGQGD